jgi:hypothetical protein
MQPRRILVIMAGVVALAAALAPNASAQAGTQGLRPSVMPPQMFAIAIHPAGHMTHGEHVAPVNFATEPGLPVHITVFNYTSTFHTITVPGLGVNALIYPARGNTPTRTIVTFTPHAYGVFSWACLLCPDEGGSAAAMHGKIYAIMHV